MRIGNWPLLMLALEHIIKHAEQYRQVKWRSDCGAFRCLAGWIAFFGGWRDVTADNQADGHFYGVNRTGRHSDGDIIEIEDAALTALELDPEYYGTDIPEQVRSTEMERLANLLFAGHREFPDILGVVKDLMKADGVTPTPLIEMEMKSAGVLSDWETW